MRALRVPKNNVGLLTHCLPDFFNSIWRAFFARNIIRHAAFSGVAET
jgi:hypothetical protein